jgi:hypothetical protein
LKHSWSLPGHLEPNSLHRKTVHPTNADGYIEARIMPNCGDAGRIADRSTQP